MCYEFAQSFSTPAAVAHFGLTPDLAAAHTPAPNLFPKKPVSVVGRKADGGLTCLIQVWPAGERMPLALAERVRRVTGARAACREDILGVVRVAGRPITRKEVVRALRAADRRHGPGTVGKALAELTSAGGTVQLKGQVRLPAPRLAPPATDPEPVLTATLGFAGADASGAADVVAFAAPDDTYDV